MKVIYIPLDERPCNKLYPEYIASCSDEINIVSPDMKILGYKKTPCNIEAVWSFLEENAKDADVAILSIDMLLYGGLLPSRLHLNTEQDLSIYIDRIKKLKSENKKLKIYAFNLIMRTPKYSSSDEEPEYYEYYGEEIFKRSYLNDKKEREGILPQEEEYLLKLQTNIPKAHIVDYEIRRNTNVQMNKKVLELLKDNIIDYLVIPQDDSCEFGYTAIDQRKINQYIDTNNLVGDVLIYPGADEVGATLLSRAYSDYKNKKVKIYPIYSSILGPQTIPLYEDRPMMESLKSHIISSGGQIALNHEEADVILAINSPGKVMQESWDQFDKRDGSYDSFRNLLSFTLTIKDFVDKGKNVILADCAYANGGDYQLIKLLDKYNILDKLKAYYGWNTHCNSLGTTLSQGIITYFGCNEENVKKSLVYHLLEDVFYQSKIRMYVNKNILPTYQCNYFDISSSIEDIQDKITQLVKSEFENTIINSFEDKTITTLSVYNPWKRMFEIGLELEVE
ncbi:DUF4127 family protein [Romboutsia sp.]|uniref:DUF4127 family protein n=1 Tax=Romboutsia sp. TaxID=1965302 RepID=UPI003F302B0A